MRLIYTEVSTEAVYASAGLLSDVEALLAAAEPLAIAPSPDGRTNAIAASPPDLSFLACSCR